MFLNRETIVLGQCKGFARWRGHLFIWMSHLAAKASDYYRIPSNRVIELGTQIQLSAFRERLVLVDLTRLRCGACSELARKASGNPFQPSVFRIQSAV